MKYWIKLHHSNARKKTVYPDTYASISQQIIICSPSNACYFNVEMLQIMAEKQLAVFHNLSLSCLHPRFNAKHIPRTEIWGLNRLDLYTTQDTLTDALTTLSHQ